MSVLSNEIAAFIKSMMGEYQSVVELRRNELAEQFGCAPSQINYVLTTRFTPRNGYLIESQRGGGGYIRIVRIDQKKNDTLLSLHDALQGKKISEREAKRAVQGLYHSKIVDRETATLMLAAISEKALSGAGKEKDQVRSNVLQALITVLLAKEG